MLPTRRQSRACGLAGFFYGPYQAKRKTTDRQTNERREHRQEETNSEKLQQQIRSPVPRQKISPYKLLGEHKRVFHYGVRILELYFRRRRTTEECLHRGRCRRR